MTDNNPTQIPSLGLLLPAIAVPVGSLVVIVGVLLSNWWISLPGLAVLVLGYAVFLHRRRQPLTVGDLLFGWLADPRPIPKDVVDQDGSDR